MTDKRRTAYSTDEPEPESPFSVLRGQFADTDSPAEQEAEPSSHGAQSHPAEPRAYSPGMARPAQGRAPVRVQRERKGRRGKTVSVVSGVAGTPSHRQELLKLLKQKLGTGGTLEDDNIIIQGDHRERIVELLKGLGYQAKIAGG